MYPPSAAGFAPPEIDWYSFLRRHRLQFPLDTSSLQHARILITGAAGSIGSALSLKLAALHPQSLVLLDSSEQALYRLQSGLQSRLPGDTTNTATILGSTTDASLLDEIFALHRPTVVFHAAAFKHVPLLEQQPLAAIANNALATQTLAEHARSHEEVKLVLLSTDKAVDPASILGASKRIAEQITLAAGGIVVRLANVLGTAGSVVEVFLNRIAAAAPIPVTGCDAERFFLTCEEAVDLLLYAAASAMPGTLLAPQLDRPHSIVALADFLIANCNSTLASPIHFTGPRVGDKISEALCSDEERAVSKSPVDCFEVEYPAIDSTRLDRELTHLRNYTQQRDFAGALEVIQQIVPRYKPSDLLLQQANSQRRAMQS